MSDRTTKQKIEFLRELMRDQNNALIKATCKDEKAALQLMIARNAEKIKELELEILKNKKCTYTMSLPCNFKIECGQCEYYN